MYMVIPIGDLERMWDLIKELDVPRIFSWSETRAFPLNAVITGTPPKQYIECLADLSDGTVLGIKSLNAEYTGNVTEQHSFDLGETFTEEILMADFLTSDLDEMYAGLLEDKTITFMKAINKVVGQKSTVIANLETILEQTVICADEELAELDEKIKAVQLELVDRATSSEGYEDLARESDRLNEEKQKILVTLAEDKGRQEKKAELIDFLHEQTTEFEKFDDGLVRRLIEQITVHESGTFTVEFKSGTMVEV